MGSCLSFLYSVARSLATPKPNHHVRRSPSCDDHVPRLPILELSSLNHGLIALPVEIIEDITQYLLPKDVLRLRQVCRQLYVKTNAVCARLFFHTITTDLSQKDVQWLASKFVPNNQLVSAVKRLQIKAINHTTDASHGFDWNLTGAGKDLQLPLKDLDMVRLLLEKHMINCRNFYILLDSDEDAPHDCLEPANVLRLLLMLAAKSDLKFESIHISGPLEPCDPHSHRLRNTHLSHSKLPMALVEDIRVKKMLANLQELTLRLIYTDELILCGWLPRAFSSLRCLRKLSLDMDLASGDVALAEYSLAKINCPHLQHFELHRFTTTISTLSAVLARCSTTLYTLDIASITAVKTPVDSSTDLNESEDNGLIWTPWMRNLSRRCPHLHSVSVDRLSTLYANRRHTHLRFRPDEDRGRLFQTGMELDTEFPIIRRSRKRKFKYTAPSSDLPLDFEFTSHTLFRQDPSVLLGMKCESDRMTEALKLAASWAVEMSII